MSSSSDIERLFEQFGGDANAYQEIGRENDARSARTRWPLLVTLDLTQPAIPAIGQLREAKPQAPVGVAPRAAVQQDTTPQDLASVTRAKAPLFTRPHRRDIPPVAVAAAQPATPSGASRFGTGEALDAATMRTTADVTSSDPAAPGLPVAPAAAAPAAIPPAVPPASPSSAFHLRAPAAQPVPPVAPVPPAAPAWARAVAPAYGNASTAPAPSMRPAQPAPQPAYPAPPAQPAQPTSILGKMFATPTPSAQPQAAAPAPVAASLNSIFDRLRGTPAQGAQSPAGATRGGFASWLTNGPRRS